MPLAKNDSLVSIKHDLWQVVKGDCYGMEKISEPMVLGRWGGEIFGGAEIFDSFEGIHGDVAERADGSSSECDDMGDGTEGAGEIATDGADIGSAAAMEREACVMLIGTVNQGEVVDGNGSW